MDITCLRWKHRLELRRGRRNGLGKPPCGGVAGNQAAKRGDAAGWPDVIARQIPPLPRSAPRRLHNAGRSSPYSLRCPRQNVLARYWARLAQWPAGAAARSDFPWGVSGTQDSEPVGELDDDSQRHVLWTGSAASAFSPSVVAPRLHHFCVIALRCRAG